MHSPYDMFVRVRLSLIRKLGGGVAVFVQLMVRLVLLRRCY